MSSRAASCVGLVKGDFRLQGAPRSRAGEELRCQSQLSALEAELAALGAPCCVTAPQQRGGRQEKGVIDLQQQQ